MAGCPFGYPSASCALPGRGQMARVRARNALIMASSEREAGPSTRIFLPAAPRQCAADNDHVRILHRPDLDCRSKSGNSVSLTVAAGQGRFPSFAHSGTGEAAILETGL